MTAGHPDTAAHSAAATRLLGRMALLSQRFTGFIALIGLVWLTGCQAAQVIELGTCDVSITSTPSTVAEAGDVVVLTATPMTKIWDTLAYVDGTPADVVSVDRVGCKSCDECRVKAACTDCGDCDTCDRLCVEECVETVSVRIPDGPSGASDVWIINSHGRSEGVTIEVLSAADTGGIDGIETRR